MRARLSHWVAGAALACLAAPAWSLDLLTAYRAALENDPNFRVAQNALAAVRENVPQARAGLLPQIQASIQRTENETVNRQRLVTGDTFDRRFSYDGDSRVLQLRQPIYRRYNWANLSYAQAQVAAAEAGFEKDRQDAGLRVTQAYFDVLLAEARVAVLQAQLEAFQGQQRLAQRAFEAGPGTRIDIDEARARVLQAEAALIDANNNVANARRSLSIFLGRMPPALADVAPDRLQLLPPQPMVLEHWTGLMDTANPELASLRGQVTVAQQDIERQRAGHHPTVDFIAARVHGANETNVAINTSYYTSYYGVQATLPIFSGGGVSAAVRQAEANLSRVRSQYDAARERIAVDLQKAFYGMAQGVDRVRASEAAVQAAEQVVLSSRRGVEAGTRTTVDVLNAVQRAAEASQALYQARYEYLVNRIRLAAAAGELDDKFFAKLNTSFALR
jgi:outer membrane protein, protease secretion system